MRSFTNDRLKRIIYAVALTILACYVAYETGPFLAGPSLRVTSPINGETLTEPAVTVTGVAKRISFITLNGRNIFVTKEGVFTESLLLLPGYNILLLEAKDSFGRTTEKRLELVYRK